MLELKKIKKDYPAGDTIVHALKGIDLKFRKSEFVSILGPSGCGKTTLLNIIGGLDKYTSGDLIINGKSTKDFKDRDWDSYRNHSIGFVFQSYNLIPHQTVLQNVELALTLSGVSKAERKERAIKALEDVGLGTQLSKKPGQMSGGQMQRVAIARALVNDPDIILADEPTGALDTETSVQVMEILKTISKDRLIIMVTHNPELAEQYSSRIIRVLDGEIISDSSPLSKEELQAEIVNDKAIQEKKGKVKMPSMSLGTAFSLSLKNLISKKGRTILTSFAGSIGIIGIALILAISEGLTGYIDTIQEETLSSYPLTIQKSNTDLTSLMSTFMGITSETVDHDTDAVYVKPAVYDIINAMNNLDTIENDLITFKEYLEKEKENTESENGLAEAISGIQYTYDLDLLVYTKNVDGEIIRSDTEELLTDLSMEYMDMNMSSMLEQTEGTAIGDLRNNMLDMMGGSAMITFRLWQEMLPGDHGEAISDLLKEQYDVIYGDWPKEYNEIVLVVDENNELDDMTIYALGLETKERTGAIIEAAIDQKELDRNENNWSYEDICDMEFRVVLNSDCYVYDENTGLYTDLRNTDAGLLYLYDNAIPLKVTGIIRPQEDVTSPMLSGSIAYTSKLTEYVIEESKDSAALQAQMEDPFTDILTGLPFKETTGSLTDEEKQEEFLAYTAKLEDTQKADVYIQIMSIPSEEQVEAIVSEQLSSLTREDMENTMLTVIKEQVGMNENDVSDYISSMSDEKMTDFFADMMAEQVKTQYAAQAAAQFANLPKEYLISAFDAVILQATTEECAAYYDEILTFSESSYETNLTTMGYLDLEAPASINIYASTFENKDVIVDAIEEYNQGRDELEQITYTDYVGLMMSSITSIINAITYILIAFVAISLIVSSIMIAVITLISVQERTKEIGILRAIGASKGNVSSMFNAETVIIGFSSGLLGILVTYLLCFPINAIIHDVTGIQNLNAALSIEYALALILISIILTLISGIIPSRSAAKKDPVVALRSE